MRASANRYANIFMPIMNNIGNLLYVLTAFLRAALLVCSGGNVLNISFENLFHTGSFAGVLSISVVASFLGMTKQFTGNDQPGLAANQRRCHGGGGRGAHF